MFIIFLNLTYFTSQHQHLGDTFPPPPLTHFPLELFMMPLLFDLNPNRPARITTIKVYTHVYLFHSE